MYLLPKNTHVIDQINYAPVPFSVTQRFQCTTLYIAGVLNETFIFISFLICISILQSCTFVMGAISNILLYNVYHVHVTNEPTFFF